VNPRAPHNALVGVVGMYTEVLATYEAQVQLQAQELARLREHLAGTIASSTAKIARLESLIKDGKVELSQERERNVRIRDERITEHQELLALGLVHQDAFNTVTGTFAPKWQFPKPTKKK
jgi:uncharacterized protein HemX